MKLDVDNKQRIQTALNFSLEFYKVLMGTFLITFVPQKCDDHVCSLSENINNRESLLHLIANIYNLITFIVVLNFYRIELKRENWSIKYLDIDATKANNNLDFEIESYPEIKENMHKLNNEYLTNCTRSIVFLCINFILSSISIGYDYVGVNTITSIVSFLILVMSKIINARNIALSSKTKERVFSAYMKIPITYNTIDNDFKECIQEVNEDIENKISVEEVEVKTSL